MNIKNQWFFALFLILSLTGCSNLPPSSNNFINYKLANGGKSRSINNVLIFPTQVAIAEIFPGGVFEESPNWSMAANSNLSQRLTNSLGSQPGIEANDLRVVQNLAGDIKRQLPFLQRVVGTIRKHTSGWDAWPHKINKFDYSVGEGLGFLKGKNIDAALYVVGRQMNHKNKYASKYGDITTYPREHITFGDLYISVCLIDINTGDILWFKHEKYRDIDLRHSSDTDRLISHLLSTFPKNLMVVKNENL